MSGHDAARPGVARHAGDQPSPVWRLKVPLSVQGIRAIGHAVDASGGERPTPSVIGPAIVGDIWWVKVGAWFVGGSEDVTTARQAAEDELVVTFGRLLGVANRLEYLLGRSIEQECGISHLMFEVLLILGRAGEPGLSMSAIGRAQVLTTGGVTRLVDRMEVAGLVERAEDPGDRRGRLVRLTRLGEQTAVRASRLHRDNLRRYLADPLPAEHWERFADDLRTLGHSVENEIPRLR